MGGSGEVVSGSERYPVRDNVRLNRRIRGDGAWQRVGPLMNPAHTAALRSMAGNARHRRSRASVSRNCLEMGDVGLAKAFGLFGTAHVGALLLTFLAPLGLCVANRSTGGGARRIVDWLLAGLLIGSEALKLVLLYRENQLSIETAAPMHLCDWAAAAALITLVYPNQRTYELCYFWALAGTLQALLTPDLSYEFPDPRFLSFFALHGGVVASTLYMTFCLGMRPIPISIPRVLACSTAYFIVAMAVNYVFNSNFGYLKAKPSHPSLLDYMAPWPLYLPQLVVLAVVLCLVFYSPFFFLDRLRVR